MWVLRVIAFCLMFGVAAGVGAWLVTPVHAAPAVCGDRAKLIEGLKNKYNEVPVALGVSQRSSEVLEIFASKQGTWTAMVTMTSPKGIACIMAAGHSWHVMPKQLEGSKI